MALVACTALVVAALASCTTRCLSGAGKGSSSDSKGERGLGDGGAGIDAKKFDGQMRPGMPTENRWKHFSTK